jgi:hypothetical protein
MATNEQIKAAAEILDDIYMLAEQLAERRLAAMGYHKWKLEGIKFNNGMIEFSYNSARCGCCNDIDYEYINADLLWNEDARKEYFGECEEAEFQLQLEEENKRSAKEARKKEERRRQFEELTKEFTQ